MQGIDGMTPYYDVELKKARQALLTKSNRFIAHKLMLEDEPRLASVYAAAKPDIVVHLAAQAGVRYSLENPRAYVDSNIVGTFNLLELMRRDPPKHFLLASTSSVYGANEKMPFVETDRTDFPITLYAATKKAGELMAHSYAHLFHIPTTTLRFFTVYGPWGRPDMALFKFVEAILNGPPDRDLRRRQDVPRFSPMSAISSKRSFVSSPSFRLAKPPIKPMRSTRKAPPHRPASSISGAASRCRCSISSPRSRQSSENPRSASYCRCNPATYPTPSRAQTSWKSSPATGPRTPVEEGVGAFVDWYRKYSSR